MRCAVLGDPVAHSLSPLLHRAAYASYGLDWEYDTHRVAAGRLAGFVNNLDATWRGLSVTAPLKKEAAELTDAVSSVVSAAGVANTLVHEDGRWLADNTDVPGAVAAVRERWAGSVTTATVLGGGATAASTGLALCDLGATTVRLLVRDPERAASTVAALGRHPAAPVVEVLPLHATPVAGEVVVSTIPAAAQTPDLVDRCAGVPLVFEVTYHPWPTPLASSVGPDRTLVSGLDLLVHQAALQFELFTSHNASAVLTPMRAALR